MINYFDATDYEYINTSEAYSEVIILGTDNAVIPYVNVCLMPGNPINGQHSTIDYSYVLFTNVHSIFFDAKEGGFTIDFSKSASKIPLSSRTSFVTLGGYKSRNSAEVKIDCDGVSLYFAGHAKFNMFHEYFVPVDTPNFRRNMSNERVQSFFSGHQLPMEIRELIGLGSHLLKLL